MKKTIYICLMTLFFSLSAFASFDEYGGLAGNFGSPVTNTGAMTSGGNFWSTNTSAMVSNNGVVTNNFDYYSPRYYVGSAGSSDQNGWSSAQSVSQYQYRPGDVINTYTFSNLVTGLPITDGMGNEQHGYIVTNGGSIIQPENSYTGYTPLQISNQIMGVGLHDPNPSNRPYFAYNSYDSSHNTNTVSVYEATANGPVLVSTKVIITYNEMPRVGILGFTGQPTPDFYAAQLSSKTSLTLAETVQYIEKYIDRVYTDIDGAGGRVAQIRTAIAKYANSLPDSQKPYAEAMVIASKNSLMVDGNPPASNPFVDGKNYVFDSDGNPKAAGADGKLIQIEIDGVTKKPSELDPNNPNQRMILTKIAVFLAQKMGTPAGYWFATGKDTDASQTSADIPASTSPIPPYITVLNMRGDKYSSRLDNIYSFTSILSHEIKHQYDFKNSIPRNLKSHVNVYIKSMEENSFKQSPPDFKLSITISLANYIFNMDKKAGYSANSTIEEIVRFNDSSSSNGGYKIIAPIDPNILSNILFNKGQLNDTNFFVYDPVEGRNINLKPYLKILPNEN